MFLRAVRTLSLLALALGVTAQQAPAAEGMWTLHDLPAERVEEELGVEIPLEWLESVQRSTVRLDGGCTGSFASPDGLVLTNNHCLWGCIRDLSSEERNLSATGFYAAERDQELSCPGQRVSVLMETEEITAAVREATAGKTDEEAKEARKAVLARLESECEESSGLGCEAVSLYHGGYYFLYKYRRYDDVRLVFAPELAIAAFGGDPDNFNFPRYCLDMSFVRVYDDNGEPASSPGYLPWDVGGAAIGEAVFVVGHPGSTQRLLTLSQLQALRRYDLPKDIEFYAELRGRLLQWAETGPEARRIVQQRILGIENALKVWRNRLFSLLDEDQMAGKEAAEAELRRRVEADPDLAERYGDAWETVDRALAAETAIHEPYLYVERHRGLQGDLYAWAATLVRGAIERPKPSEERLREFRDTALPRIEQILLAERPVPLDYETLRLSYSLEKMREHLGPDDPTVKRVLGQRAPESVAEGLVSGSRLADPAIRRRLWEGGIEAIEASDDAMIVLARELEPIARQLRERYDREVEAPLERASEQIAEARFEALGTSVYPDATFTLRVSYGEIAGWSERGAEVQPFTTLGTTFERATGEDPFRLPDRWLKAREELDLDTRFDFVSSTDIIGGNSGSPVIDAKGRLVGLAFDGNIHSIAGAYWFDERVNRTVSVHPAAMAEALRVVYGADPLLEELELVEP